MAFDCGFSAEGDLTDFWVVEAALGALVGFTGMSGTVGFVVLRLCFGAAALI
jgi:hypothetical protein